MNIENESEVKLDFPDAFDQNKEDSICYYILGKFSQARINHSVIVKAPLFADYQEFFALQSCTEAEITLLKALDRESIAKMTLRILASNNCTCTGAPEIQQESLLNVTISVLDVNDNPPMFDQAIIFQSMKLGDGKDWMTEQYASLPLLVLIIRLLQHSWIHCRHQMQTKCPHCHIKLVKYQPPLATTCLMKFPSPSFWLTQRATGPRSDQTLKCCLT